MPSAERIRRGRFALDPPRLLKTGTAVLGALLVLIVISRIIYPFDLGHQEAFSLMPAAHLLEGKNPYSFAFVPPYSMVPYGIVYYALLAIGKTFFGFQLWWGRALSFLGFAVCVWAVCEITKKLTFKREAVWAAGLISLAFFPAQAWVAVMRSDFIALAFAFVALCLVFGDERRERLNALRLIAVILLCAAAFFTKHTALLPVGIVFLRFLQLGSWRAAFIFGATFAALVLTGVFLLDSTSGGGYVWQHFTHAKVLPFSNEKLFEGVRLVASLPTTVVFTAILLFYLYGRCLIFREKSRGQLSRLIESPKMLILFYLFISLTAAIVSSGRVGANVNYYLEVSFVAAIAGGLIFEDFIKNKRFRLISAVVILFVLGGGYQMARVARGEYFRWQALAFYREVSETTAQYTPPGSVCFSVYVELAARNGCAFEFDDYGEYTMDWEPQLNKLFVDEVKNSRFAVIIWSGDNFQEEFPNYRLIRMTQAAPERFPPVYLYVRKNENSR